MLTFLGVSSFYYSGLLLQNQWNIHSGAKIQQTLCKVHCDQTYTCTVNAFFKLYSGTDMNLEGNFLKVHIKFPRAKPWISNLLE